MGKKNAIDTLGITCPAESLWYVCQFSGFIGCCHVDPCQQKDGICPQKELEPAGFKKENYDKIGVQQCLASSSTGGNSTLFWACAANNPPFFGCCDINPCGTSCPQDHLRATLMAYDQTGAVFRDYENGGGGLSKGAIAGIAAGSGAVLVLIIGIAVFFHLRKKRKNQRPAVPAKNDAYMSPMTQFSSPMRHSAHPSHHGGHPFSPQQPGAESPGYFFPPSQTPGSPPYYPNGHVPIPPRHSQAKSPYDTSTSPISVQTNYYNPQMAAELPAMPDVPSRHSVVLRAASTTTYKGNKRGSASSRMTAPLPEPPHHHTHNHELAELGETQITAEMGDSTKKDPNSPR